MMRIACRLSALTLALLALTGGSPALAGIGLDNPTPADKNKPLNVPAPAGGSGRAAAPAKGERSPLGDVLYFKGDDSLRGNLGSIGADESLVWTRPDVDGPVRIRDLAQLRGVKLQRLAPPENPDGLAIVRLTNDDQLRGKIVGMDDNRLTLETGYAGRIAIERLMVAGIRPGSASAGLLYSGPNKIGEWLTSGQWEIKRGRLVGQGSAGRDMKLPDLARIKFDVVWQGRYLNFQVALFADNVKNFDSNCYVLNFNGNGIYLTRSQGQSNLGQAEVRSLTAGKPMHFEVLCDKNKKTIAVFVNGELAKQWLDPQPWGGRGGGLLFFNGDNSNTVHFSRIQVSTWDGKLPTAAGEAKTKGEDLIQFTNDDKVSGKFLAITDGTIAFKTDFATLAIPLARVADIQFAEDNQERARRNKKDVQAWFPSGDRLTFQLKAIKDGQVSGASENFGDLNCRLAVFAGLKFNIYDSNPDKDDDALDTQPSFEQLLLDDGS